MDLNKTKEEKKKKRTQMHVQLCIIIAIIICERKEGHCPLFFTSAISNVFASSQNVFHFHQKSQRTALHESANHRRRSIIATPPRIAPHDISLRILSWMTCHRTFQFEATCFEMYLMKSQIGFLIPPVFP